MSEPVPFTVVPPLRCFGRPLETRGLVCARRAAWMRPNKLAAAPTFFCDRCRQPTDVPISDDVMFRRVTVNIDVMLAGVSMVPGAAHTEAVALIESLVRASGGVCCLHAVTSHIGRYTPATGADALRPKQGRG